MHLFAQAFKFPDVMDLTIECNVELCKTECSPCSDPDQVTRDNLHYFIPAYSCLQGSLDKISLVEWLSGWRLPTHYNFKRLTMISYPKIYVRKSALVATKLNKLNQPVQAKKNR